MSQNQNTREPIHPKNDAWMVANFGRVPKVTPISFKKTDEERRQLNKLSRRARKGPNSNNEWHPDNSLEHRLTIHVKNQVTIDKNKFKTTYSCMCQKADILLILNLHNIKKDQIVKIYWNGKIQSI